MLALEKTRKRGFVTCDGVKRGKKYFSTLVNWRYK